MDLDLGPLGYPEVQGSNPSPATSVKYSVANLEGWRPFVLSLTDAQGRASDNQGKAVAMPTKQYPAPGWRDYIAQWLDSLKAGAYAASTINTRRCQLTAISQALGGSPLDVEASDLVAYFAGREWKPETRKSARNACAGFFGWMLQTGHIDTDHSRALPSIRRPHPHPRPCPDIVILKALSKATDQERLMLRLGAEAGFRRFEIAKISDADLVRDLMGWSLMVIGKGDVQRMVPISDDLAGEIRAHGPGYIFPGRWGSHVEASYVGKTPITSARWMVRTLAATPVRHPHMGGDARPAAREPTAGPRLGGDHATLRRHAVRTSEGRRIGHTHRMTQHHSFVNLT